MNKKELIAKLQTRLDDLCDQCDALETGFDKTILLGRTSELLETLVTIIDMPEVI